jgi:ATP-dependent RNA helicase DeaD
VLRSGRYAPYLLVLEPLFDEFDPAEVAAAVLQWSRESGAADSSGAVREREKAVGALPGERVRIFLGVGERDGVRPADIVGAIAGECGITGNRIGRIDLRPSHSVVEVDAEVAPLVLERMSGAAIRGRRVMPRLDRQPAGRREG